MNIEQSAWNNDFLFDIVIDCCLSSLRCLLKVLEIRPVYVDVNFYLLSIQLLFETEMPTMHACTEKK